MPDALDNVITEITTLMEAMTGINQAPENPPEGINDPPMVVTYHVRMVPSYSQSYQNTIHTIYCDVFLPRATLPTSEAQARPYVLRGLVSIAGSLKLSSMCSHCILTEVIGPGPLPYQDQQYFGVRYILEVKLGPNQLSLTVAA